MNIHINIHTDRSPVRLDTIDDLYWSTQICASVYTYIYKKKYAHPCASAYINTYMYIHTYTYKYGDTPFVLQNDVKCMYAYICIRSTYMRMNTNTVTTLLFCRMPSNVCLHTYVYTLHMSDMYTETHIQTNTYILHKYQLTAYIFLFSRVYTCVSRTCVRVYLSLYLSLSLSLSLFVTIQIHARLRLHIPHGSEPAHKVLLGMGM